MCRRVNGGFSFFETVRDEKVLKNDLFFLIFIIPYIDIKSNISQKYFIKIYLKLYFFIFLHIF